MAQSTEATGKWEELSHLAVHTPIQVGGGRCGETPAGDSAAFLPKVAPWQLQSLFRFNETGFPQTPDYDKKLLEWQPPSSWTPSTSTEQPLDSPAWEAPAGLPRPQPQMPKVEPMVEVDVEGEDSDKEETAIEMAQESAFAPPERRASSSSMEEEPPPLLRPLPLPAARVEQTENNASSSSDAAPSCEASSAGFSRPPGLGPPKGTNGANAYLCPICGFSCNSKFHYNSHMNTHGDHQCSMCDYTSRTEGRLKKHMRESHSLEEQMAAGLDLSPPAASAPATPAVAAPEGSPSKEAPEAMEFAVPEDAAPSVIVSTASVKGGDGAAMPSPSTLSSALLNMISSSPSSSALDQMRAITEKPLLSEGSPGLLLMGNPLLGLSPASATGMTPRKEGSSERRGKAKQYKCKQCPHVSVTKEEQWEHHRLHIPTDKQLTCPKCNFVTEYKHHLEYHIRNHLGSKPFQCKKCAYTCVNKSMLNSHMKSHTNVYQFRCENCTYATKYCHSLKLHLKKYGHQRKMESVDGVPMGEDGSSPPQMRKDSSASLASSLSGPFTPFSIKKEDTLHTPVPVSVSTFSFGLPHMASSSNLNYATQMLLRQHQMEQLLGMGPLQLQQPSIKCGLCDFVCRSNDELMRHNVSHLLSGTGLYGLGMPSSLGIPERSAEDDDTTGSPPGDDAVSHSNASTGSPVGSGRGSGEEEAEGGGRRKSKASRIDEIGQRLRDKASPDTLEAKTEAMDTDESSATATALVSSEEAPLPSLASATPPALAPPESSSGTSILQQAYFAHLLSQSRADSVWKYECPHCPMGFQDEALHQIHMGYHGFDNVFQCNRCGQTTGSALAFNLHLLQSSHGI